MNLHQIMTDAGFNSLISFISDSEQLIYPLYQLFSMFLIKSGPILKQNTCRLHFYPACSQRTCSVQRFMPSSFLMQYRVTLLDAAEGGLPRVTLIFQSTFEFMWLYGSFFLFPKFECCPTMSHSVQVLQ